MKTTVFFFAICMIATITSLSASGVQDFFSDVKARVSQPDEPGAQITPDKDVHDYGTVQQGAFGECVFTITNSGTEPLIISECKGSCSCTIPAWPKEPVLPGESARIVVKYDMNRVGPINKTVTVYSNAVNEPTLMLRIKGNVVAPTTPAVPVNP